MNLSQAYWHRDNPLESMYTVTGLPVTFVRFERTKETDMVVRTRGGKLRRYAFEQLRSPRTEMDLPVTVAMRDGGPGVLNIDVRTDYVSYPAYKAVKVGSGWRFVPPDEYDNVPQWLPAWFMRERFETTRAGFNRLGGYLGVAFHVVWP